VVVGANVIVTEYGRAASSALAQTIVDAKAGVALAPVTVIVPSNFAGLAARRMLGSGALGVAGVANVNFVTPFRLAELLAVGELRGRKPLTKPVLAAGVRRALADDPRHFRNVRDHHATERALAAAVGELSNVSAAGREAIRAHGGHATSIIELFDAIKSHLRDFHDEADVARAAAHRSDLVKVVAPFGHLIWHLPGLVSAPLASFLRSVLGVSPTTVIAATVGDDQADREVFRTMRIAGIEFAPINDDQRFASSSPLADHIISVTDADDEVRAVLREVIQLVDRGTPLDRIGIFHPAPDPYVRILEQHFAAAGISANGPSRRRLSESIAGRVLLGALALPSERWRRDRVIALVNSGPLRHELKPARPAVWDLLSRYAGVVGGLNDWRAKLQVERHRIDVAQAEADSAANAIRVQRLIDQRADLDDLSAFVNMLADSLSAVESARGWQARAQAATQLLHGLLGGTHMRTRWPEAEISAFESVDSVLERLAMLEDLDPNPSMAVFVRALASELSVARARSGRFGEGVVYGPLSSAPGHDLEAVFVLGCTEGLCPTPRREDVLLSDSVRKLAGGDLSLRLGQIDEQHRLFLAAVASAPPGKRWLFFPRGDLRSSRRSRPSRWLLPSASELAGRLLYATDFEDQCPQGVYEVASHAEALMQASHYASVDERDVAAVFAYVREGGEAATHPASELVARGLRTQIARRSADFTEFDGNIAGVPARASGDVMSASRLETWATCGFRYYLTYVLGLAARDDPEHTIELSALDRGSALHDVLEKFMREQVQVGPPRPHEPWTADQRERAQEIASEVFDEYERRGRTGRRIEWETQKSDLLALIDDFLTQDFAYRAARGATPAHFELAFGMGQNEPLEIMLDDGRSLRFRGMIDRVDEGPSGSKLVSDYKTGSGNQYKGLGKEDDPTRQGTLLQLGLYAEAVASQLGASAISADYWMVNTGAGFARHGYPWTPSHRERLVEVLTSIADGIEAGAFAAIPGEWQSFRSTYENCAYCDFDTVCPRGRAEQAADKAEAPELAVRVALVPRPPEPGV
jgi:ATP-dependent helicase/nuclease subunit B